MKYTYFSYYYAYNLLLDFNIVMLENIIQTIQILSNELVWIDEEIAKITKKEIIEDLPEGRVDIFLPTRENDIMRLEFLLLRNREIRYRIEDIYSSINRVNGGMNDMELVDDICER